MSEDRLLDGNVYPQSLEFLAAIWAQEDRCEEETDRRVPQMGKKVPRLMEHLGSVLSFLDRMATCYWGCREGDHTVEYLTGRIYSSARASLRLMRFGFYDEALSLTRSIGEITNLLFLFLNDRNTLDDWKAADKKKRKIDFSPLAVRIALEKRGSVVPVDEKTYAELCEVATHVTPETKPQAHNSAGRPVLGGYFQDAGVLLTLNQLADTVSLATLASVVLLDIEPEKRQQIGEEAWRLLKSVGGVKITDMKETWAMLRVKERPDA